jgi:hypothetical protein
MGESPDIPSIRQHIDFRQFDRNLISFLLDVSNVESKEGTTKGSGISFATQ